MPARPRRKMVARGVEEGGIQQGGFQLEPAFFRNLQAYKLEKRWNAQSECLYNVSVTMVDAAKIIILFKCLSVISLGGVAGSAPFIIGKIYSRGMPKTFAHDLYSSVVNVGSFLARCSFICWPDSWLQLSLWHEPQLVPMTWWRNHWALRMHVVVGRSKQETSAESSETHIYIYIYNKR